MNYASPNKDVITQMKSFLFKVQHKLHFRYAIFQGILFNNSIIIHKKNYMWLYWLIEIPVNQAETLYF